MTDTLMKGQADYANGTLDLDWYCDAVLHNVRLYAWLGFFMFVTSNISVSYIPFSSFSGGIGRLTGEVI